MLVNWTPRLMMLLFRAGIELMVPGYWSSVRMKMMLGLVWPLAGVPSRGSPVANIAMTETRSSRIARGAFKNLMAASSTSFRAQAFGSPTVSEAHPHPVQVLFAGSADLFAPQLERVERQVVVLRLARQVSIVDEIQAPDGEVGRRREELSTARGWYLTPPVLRHETLPEATGGDARASLRKQRGERAPVGGNFWRDIGEIGDGGREVGVQHHV